ncbi:MAG TPA: copper resistance CopC family protein [Thermoanaerobaculia bacterium]|nr:copper resistance CopC family protein [Thermoanaerobaculia bacterium]
MSSRLLRRGGLLSLGVALLIAATPAAFAHAILVEASPAAGSTVGGPDFVVRLRFNSRVDGARSHLGLVQVNAAAGGSPPVAGGTSPRQERAVTIDPQPSPERLTAKLTGIAPGAYRLRWQVLAADGHITRGEVPFRVK